MRVEVTAEDIRRGKPESCSQCPVARALRRALRDRTWCVGHYCAYNGAGREFDLPGEVIAFVW